ncbi:MAG: hypothetical protein WBP72_19380 [Rhodocyclaceae bacterium]
MAICGIVVAATDLNRSKRGGIARCALLLVLAVSPAWASAADDFDDDVAACLAAHRLEPYSPAFFQAIPLCQREVQPVRQARAERLAEHKAVWADCMIERIVTLDNGVAAAADVAAAAQGACEDEYAAVVDSMDLTPEGRASVYQKRHSVTKEVSTGMVLDVRAAMEAERPKGKAPSY